MEETTRLTIIDQRTGGDEVLFTLESEQPFGLMGELLNGGLTQKIYIENLDYQVEDE